MSKFHFSSVSTTLLILTSFILVYLNLQTNNRQMSKDLTIQVTIRFVKVASRVIVGIISFRRHLANLTKLL